MWNNSLHHLCWYQWLHVWKPACILCEIALYIISVDIGDYILVTWWLYIWKPTCNWCEITLYIISVDITAYVWKPACTLCEIALYIISVDIGDYMYENLPVPDME
jgi:hypothetical protein